MRKRKVIQNILKLIVIILMIVGFGQFVYFLSNSKTTKVEQKISWSATVNDAITSKVILVGETDKLELYFKDDSTEVWVKDKNTGEIWRSNPEDGINDSIAFGLDKTNVLSQIKVDYIDSQNSANVVNSYLGSVKEKTYDYKLADNGVYVTYYFQNTGFEVPVFYGLKDDYFTAKILCEDIKEYGTYRINSITLLPYMGAGNLEDDGYLVIPDGCGSRIDFNNQKQTYQSYSQAVYGCDLALNLLSQNEVKEAITMPIFGIKRNDYSMLGIITQGEFQANIEAEVSRKSTSYNIAYSKINFMQLETNKLFANSANEENTLIWSEQFKNFPEYEVRYYFLGKDSTYTDMALRYQKYLVDEKGMTSIKEEAVTVPRVNLELIGAVEKKDTFFGIPYQTVEVLTSYSDVEKIAKELTLKMDMELSIQYKGFLNDGLTGKLPSKIRYDSRLGGKSNFKKMKENLEKSNIELFPSFDLVDLYQSGGGYYKFDATRNVNRSAALQYKFLLSTGEKTLSVKPSYLLAPNKVEELSSKFMKAIKKNNMTTIGLEGITNKVYSNFKKNGTSRNIAGSIFVKVLSDIANASEELLLDKAYAYAMPYADRITNTPVKSSGFDMSDGSIPFYQIVMAGYATLYSEPVNMQGNQQMYLLKLAETGVNPSFKLIAANPMVLMNTNYAYLYSVSYEAWKEDIIQIADRFSELSATYNQGITEHEEIAEKVFKTTYQNGAVVYTNYNKKPVTVEGITVEALNFSVKDGK